MTLLDRKSRTVRVTEGDDNTSSSSDDDWDDVQDIGNSSDDDQNATKQCLVIKNKTEKVQNKTPSSSSNESEVEDEYQVDSEANCDEEEEGQECSGLANVMKQILNTKKNAPSNEVILSKALKDGVRDNKRKQEEDKLDGQDVDVKKSKIQQEVKFESSREKDIRRKEWENMYRVKPDIVSDRGKERNLRILATQGVVQLFSAFEKHHHQVKRKLAETKSEIQREKILQETNKDSFLNILVSEGKKNNIKDETKLEEKTSIPSAEVSRWNVLAEEFYEDPKLKSWNKMEEDDD